MIEEINRVLQRVVNSITRVSERVDSIETRIQNEKIRWTSQQISSGEISASSKAITMIPESGTTDDIDTISNGYDGMKVVLTNDDPTYTITVKTTIGNIEIGFDSTINNVYTTVVVVYRESDGKWIGV